MAYPRFQRSRSFKVNRLTSGTFSITTTSYMAISTAIDIALNCQVGDVIETGLMFIWDNTATEAFGEVCTMNGSTIVNYASGAGASGNGITGLYVPSTMNQYDAQYGAVFYTVQAGDIFSGLVTLRPFAKVTSSNRVILGNTNNPLTFWAKNLGPVDPN